MSKKKLLLESQPSRIAGCYVLLSTCSFVLLLTPAFMNCSFDINKENLKVRDVCLITETFPKSNTLSAQKEKKE